MEKWFSKNMNKDLWEIEFQGYTPGLESTRESLLTVGNGHFGTRGSFEESTADGIHYPGTYIAGLYNKVKSEVAGRDIYNEDFVNAPDWTWMTFKIGENGKWFSLAELTVLECHRSLQMSNGLYSRRLHVKDSEGRETLIGSKRLISQSNKHIAAMKYALKPLNYSDKLYFKSGLNGNVMNWGVKRYKNLNSKHLSVIEEKFLGDTGYLKVRTSESSIDILMTFKNVCNNVGKQIIEDGKIYELFEIDSEQGRGRNEGIVIEKIISVSTSNTMNKLDPFSENILDNYHSFEKVFSESQKAWKNIWDRADIEISGNTEIQKLLRFNIYHLFTTFSLNNREIDAGIPARGLHGEAYRGHIFWDELFIIPFYNITFPEVSKAAFAYRYNRLEKAMETAKEQGFSGALYPWQSGSSGAEETQTLHLNPMSGKWDPDWSYRQRHVSLSIGYSVIRYYHETQDHSFMVDSGLKMLLEICKFWSSLADFDNSTGRFHIKGVMGPDEYHEKSSFSEEGGLIDNSYTNIMTGWLLGKTLEILETSEIKQQVIDFTSITVQEKNNWSKISKSLTLVLSDDGILSQFKGYFDLAELDWDFYRKKFKIIKRMDRILKAEGKSPDNYKVAKQADLLMAFFNLGEEEINELLEKMGYPFSKLSDNFDYYMPRTSHGSTLSKIVHASLAAKIGRKDIGLELFYEALKSDYNDVQGGTTCEGIHTGVMAGSVMLVLNSFAGIDTSGDQLKIKCDLPEEWDSLKCSVNFKKILYQIHIENDCVRIKACGNTTDVIQIDVNGVFRQIQINKIEKFQLKGDKNA